jgi:hypothetical protein
MWLRRPIFILLTLIAFVNYGCMQNWVVHQKATPTKETRIASGPNTTKVRELTVSAQPTVSTPHVPVILLYSERVTGPEEMVDAYEQREYNEQWVPLLIIPPTLLFLALYPILLAISYILGPPEKPSDDYLKFREEVNQWGCPDLNTKLLYGLIGYAPCGFGRGKQYREKPEAEEEIHQTDRTREERHPLPRQLVQVTVVAQGAQWQTNTVLTVLTDAEGQESIPLDSVFKESPNAPLEVSVILTTDEAQTTVHLDSQACEAIYTHVRK